MADVFDPLQLYDALMRVLGMREREGERTLAQSDARIPRSPQGYLQEHPQGYVPPGPEAPGPRGQLGVVQEDAPRSAAARAELLGDRLRDYNSGRVSTPGDVVRYVEALRALLAHLREDSGEADLPGMEDEILRHIGWRRTPQGLERISEEEKPPLG